MRQRAASLLTGFALISYASFLGLHGRFSMGCASSKDAGTDEAKEQPKDTAKPEDVTLSNEPSAPITNAAGRRVSKTVRRVAVRCAMPCNRRFA